MPQKFPSSIQGHAITRQASIALATQLTALKGRELLCERLRTKKLPYSVTLQINERKPLDTPILQNNAERKKISKNLYWTLHCSDVFKQWAVLTTNPKELMGAVVRCLEPARALAQSPMLYYDNVISRLILSFREAYTMGPEGFNMLKSFLIDMVKALDERSGIRRILSGIVSAHAYIYSGSAELFTKAELLMIELLQDEGGYNLTGPIRYPLMIDQVAELDKSNDNLTGQALMLSRTSMRFFYSWPLNSMYSVCLPPASMLLQFLMLNSQYVAFDRLPSASLVNHFQNHSKHNATSMSNLSNYKELVQPGLRIHLFRLGCLKVMDNVLIRVLNVDKVKHELVRFDKDIGSELFSLSLNVNENFVMKIDRDDLLDSAINSLKESVYLENIVRRPLRIQFGNLETNYAEIGVDQGGVQVEFFQEIGSRLIEKKYFVEDETSRLVWFGNKQKVIDYEYLGMLFGIGILNGCIISVSFPKVLYRILLAKVNVDVELEDIEDLYPDLHRSYSSLQEIPDFSDLELTFEATEQVNGKIETVELPSFERYNGKETEVTWISMSKK